MYLSTINNTASLKLPETRLTNECNRTSSLAALAPWPLSAGVTLLRNISWLSPDGAPIDPIETLESEVADLAGEYDVELLKKGNGGEVDLKVNQFDLCIDSAESASDFWRSESYTMDNIFVFGGDGGGILSASDMRRLGHFSGISFDPIDTEGSTEEVASNFGELLAHIEEDDA